MNILGIETSCDETSIAVLEYTNRQIKLKSHLISSQVKLHAPWGGVVPELAARQHTETIIPLLDEGLRQAHNTFQKIDLITVTGGPGLITALQVGVETAKALALAWQKPLLAVNHIAGHLVSPWLTKGKWQLVNKKSTWPSIALVVSGGHTEIYLLKNLRERRLLGKTLDDAAGEAFDKVAKLLQLPYPGGPQVAKLATKGNATAFVFPRPLLNRPNYDFSYAGLKTSVLYTCQKLGKKLPEAKADICASFQAAAIEVLVKKTMRAAKDFKAKTILVTGGVAANQYLRESFTKEIIKGQEKYSLHFPDPSFTGDNAAMIALAGAVEANSQNLKKYQLGWRQTQARSNWELW